MANQIVVWSKTTRRWIAPRFGEEFRVITRLRRKEGDEAIILIPSKSYLRPPQRVHVMVEKSDNGHWWLVEKKNG